MKNKIIQEVLKMVEETEDIRKINLRQIAKRVGCAHTNVYNYFNCVEEMLWHAVVPALQLIKESTTDKIKSMKLHSAEEQVKTVFKLHLEFALEHPGIFRFIWFEKPADVALAPKELPVLLQQNWLDFINMVFAFDTELSNDQKDSICRILFGYLQGETSRLISERYFFGTRGVLIQEIIENGARLFRLLSEDLIVKER